MMPVPLKRKCPQLEVVVVDDTTRKKRKTSKEKMKSIYTNPSDQSQFFFLFKCIQNAEIAKNLNVPSCLIKEIAEFGIGQTIKCKSCHRKIVIIHQDFEKNLDGIQGVPNHESYQFCKDGKFECVSCHNGQDMIICDAEFCQNRDTEPQSCPSFNQDCNHCYSQIIGTKIELNNDFKKYHGVKCIKCQDLRCYLHKDQFAVSALFWR